MSNTPNDALAKLRHLYANMMQGSVRDTASAKRIAEGLLAPAIELLERSAAQLAVVREPLTDEQIEDYCFAAIRIGRDAARYRWLRDTSNADDPSHMIALHIRDEQNDASLSGIDAAIDAALAAQGGK